MSIFGKYFRVTTFGESHSKGVGCVIDNIPANILISVEDIQKQLNRRRPGQSELSTQRNEKDRVFIYSGVENNVTIGSPFCLIVYNEDHNPLEYISFENIPRPSHSDYTYLCKYGIKASSGGGRSSARETIGRVAAGSVAEKLLKELYSVEIIAFVSSVGDIYAEVSETILNTITRKDVDTDPVIRCCDLTKGNEMKSLIQLCQNEGNSIGGVVTCVVRNCPVGWGEPCFDKLEAMLAYAMLSIPATKGFEIGSGFSGCKLKGNVHNDLFIFNEKDSSLKTKTNYSGGIQGGISNGMPIYFNVGFKPPATIRIPQETVSFDGQNLILSASGRHDPCVVARAVPIVEAMAALVLADAALANEAKKRFSIPSIKICNENK